MIDRRSILLGSMAALGGAVASRAAQAQGAKAPISSQITAYAFSFPALSGDDIRLAAFTSRPLLVVNTASLCGYTPQYAGLQTLWTEFHDRGLAIVGVPSNDFNQEPGAAARAVRIEALVSDAVVRLGG